MLPENMREGGLSALLNADDLVLMSETIKGLRNNLFKWNEAFENKGLKVSLGKTKVMVTGGITNDDISKIKVVPCGVWSLRVNSNSMLCAQCGKWINSRCAGVKSVTQKLSRNLACRK